MASFSSQNQDLLNKGGKPHPREEFLHRQSRLGRARLMGLFRCTTLPDCPAGFSGWFSHPIHRIISARFLNKLASFWPQFSQVRLSSSRVYNSIGGRRCSSESST